jgi:hypothetical protein
MKEQITALGIIFLPEDDSGSHGNVLRNLEDGEADEVDGDELGDGQDERHVLFRELHCQVVHCGQDAVPTQKGPDPQKEKSTVAQFACLS